MAWPAELNVITTRTVLKDEVTVTNFPKNLSMSITINLSTEHMFCAIFFKQQCHRKVKQITYKTGRSSIKLFWEDHPEVLFNDILI